MKEDKLCFQFELTRRGESRYLYAIAESMEDACKKIKNDEEKSCFENIKSCKLMGKAI